MKARPALSKIFLCVLLAFSAMVFAATDKIERDNSRISIFAQPAISFLDFEKRKYFQNAVDTIYKEFYSQALTESESLTVAKQDFQKVNFCFPLTAGLQFQPIRDNFLSVGVSFIYDHESVVLTDRKNKSHSYNYTIQGIPLFLEYRLAIPKNLMSITDESLFSVALRWYWVLPGTEIYTSWGKIDAETPAYGGGFGISIGYLLASWKGVNIFGDVGYSSIPIKSKESYADIVPDGPTEKAKWNIGGLQLQIRASFGLWNYPKVEEDSTKKADSLKTVAGLKKAAPGFKETNADSLQKTSADSLQKTCADTNKTATDKADSVKDEKADSAKADSLPKIGADTTKTSTETAKQSEQPAIADSTKPAEAKKETKPADPVKPVPQEAKKDEPQKPSAVKATGP